jgi:hypothetical protein
MIRNTFPYRWGHAFWAYIGAKYGDRAVASLLRSAANPRFDLVGLARQLGTGSGFADRRLAHGHHSGDLRGHFEEFPYGSAARQVISRESGGGRFNVGPRISPDGKEIAFFSERDRFSVELYVADADTGKVLRKLSSSATDPHFDSLEFLNSAGAWSPDGKSLAIGAIKNGKPVVALLDARSGHVDREIALPGLDDVLNPVYSPDGKWLAFSGNRGGFVDLYRVALNATGDGPAALDRLTNDPFADLEPVFLPDGTGLVFVTERYSTNLDTLEAGPCVLRGSIWPRDHAADSGVPQGKASEPAGER